MPATSSNVIQSPVVQPRHLVGGVRNESGRYFRTTALLGSSGSVRSAGTAALSKIGNPGCVRLSQIKENVHKNVHCAMHDGRDCGLASRTGEGVIIGIGADVA